MHLLHYTFLAQAQVKVGTNAVIFPNFLIKRVVANRFILIKDRFTPLDLKMMMSCQWFLII